MKKVFLCAAMMAVGMATAEAERTVEDVASQLGRLMDETWAMQGGQQVWSHPPRGQLTTCTVLIAQLDKLGAPKTTPIKLATKTPQWEPGEIPLEAAREVCDDWVVYGAVGDWWMSLQMAIYEAEKIGTSAYYDTAIFNLCLMQYAKLLEKGVKPSSPFPERKVTLSSGTEVVITGTVEEVRTKYCDVGMAKVREEMEAKFAPYKKALKNDKLSMVVIAGANSARAYILPGGKITTDPKKLAAAKVWFSDTTTSDRAACRGQDQHVVHRYQFDAKHKLVKTTDKQYCGKVPARAFK